MDLCPIDFPIYIYMIRKDLYILCFKRSQVEISKFWYVSVPEDCLHFSKQSRPSYDAWGISSESSLFAKVPVYKL